jgi:hypothetical protein
MFFTRRFQSNISGKNATVSRIVPPETISFDTFFAKELRERRNFFGEDRTWRPKSHYESYYYSNRFRADQTEIEWKVGSLTEQYKSDVEYRKSTVHGFKLGEIYRCGRFHRDKLDFSLKGELSHSVWFGEQQRSYLPKSQGQWTAEIEIAHWYEEKVTHDHIDHILGGVPVGNQRMTFGFHPARASFRTIALESYELILFDGDSARVELQIR